jgi:hypothetical protein
MAKQGLERAKNEPQQLDDTDPFTGLPAAAAIPHLWTSLKTQAAEDRECGVQGLGWAGTPVG